MGSLRLGSLSVGSVFLLRAFVLVAAGSLVVAGSPERRVNQAREFRVCADPNNLPYSNRRQEGFENKIAELIAAELNASVSYTWWPQRRGFIRNTLRERTCDVVMGVPSSYELVLTTKPYYRSTYVFLYRKNSGFQIGSFDDPILRQLKIGVHTIGDDYANSPPAHALGQRQIVQNVVGYSVYRDYSEENPPAAIVHAVAVGEVDVAIVWGPIAGYFARQQGVELELVPVTPAIDLPFLPFVYDISMGVRREEEGEALKEELEAILARKSTEVRRILQDYGVPIVGFARPRAQTVDSSQDTSTGALAQTLDKAQDTATVTQQGPKKLNPYTGNTEAIAEGRKLYLKHNCYGCHGLMGGGGMGKPLNDAEWLYGGDDASVLETIMQGREGGMPPYKDLLNEDDAWKVIAYMRSYYKGDPSKAPW